MDIIRRAADPECSDNLVRSVEFVDAVLSIPPLRGALKELFGLRDLEHDEDFVSLLSVSPLPYSHGKFVDDVTQSPMGYWQAKVWDPAIGSTGFEEFCAALAKPLGRARIGVHDAETQTVALPGGLNVPKVVYNYAQYIKEASPVALLTSLPL